MKEEKILPKSPFERSRNSAQGSATPHRLPYIISGLFIVIAAILAFVLTNPSLPRISSTSQTASSTSSSAKSQSSQKTTSPITNLTLSVQLHRAWRSVAKANPNQHVSIAIYSPTTKNTYSYTNSKNHKFYTASSVKVDILAAVLHNQNGKLTDSEKSSAEAMIVNSNNDAASMFYGKNYLNRTGLQEMFTELGMTNSKAGKTFGVTTTTAADQLRVLRQIFYSSSYLNDDSQDYIKDLMYNVEADQRWGISAGSKSYYNKNGWLYYNAKTKWIINSIGQVTLSNGQNYVIAIYTDNNATQENGENLVEDYAQATADVMKKLN